MHQLILGIQQFDYNKTMEIIKQTKLNHTLLKQIFLETDISQLSRIPQIREIIMSLTTINKFSIYSSIIDHWYKQHQNAQNIFQYCSFIEQMAFIMLIDDQNQTNQQLGIWLKNISTDQTGFLEICLLQETSYQKYSFIHPSLLSLNATRYIIKQITKLHYQYQPYEIVKSSSVCIFIKEWFDCDKSLYGTMFDIIQKSKFNKTIEKSAAAAITILNIVGYKFKEVDFSQISIPHAFLVNGYLQNVNLQNSNLKSVAFDKAYCVGTNFNGCDLRGATFKQITIDYKESVRCIDIDKSGKRLIVAKDKRMITIYDFRQLKKISQWITDSHILCIKIAPNGKTFSIAGYGEQLSICDSDTGNIIKIFEGHTSIIWCVSYSSDGSKLVSCSSDQCIKIWDVESGKNINTLKGHHNNIYSVGFSPDDKMIISGGSSQLIKIWDAQTGCNLYKLQQHKGSVKSICYSPDQKRIASCGRDHTIKIWDTIGHKIISLKQHNHTVWSVCYAPNGKTLVSGSEDKSIKIWNSQSGIYIKSLQKHNNSVLSVLYSPDGMRIISASSDKSIKIWNIITECGYLIRSQNTNRRSQSPTKPIRSFEMCLKGIKYNNVIGYDRIIEQLQKLD